MVNRKIIFNNLIWRYGERTGAQLVGFIVSIVLARILSPEDYGTVAILIVFVGILQVFVDSGLGNALIQKKDADDLDFSTVFYVNIIFCSLLYLLLFFISPAIADFYNDPQLTKYIRVLGIIILISGVKNVQQAYVSKHMLFRKFFYSTLGGTIVSGVLGIILAIRGYGVWALIFQQISNTLIDTLILWLIVHWRPKRLFSYQRLKGLFGFGWKMLASSLINTTYNDLRQLIIGKVYSSDSLAYYNRGYSIPDIIVSNVNKSIDSVLFPAMATVQDNLSELKSITRRSITISIFIMAPMMIGLAAISEPMVRLLLTDKWLPAVPYMRIFCVVLLFYPIHAANLNAINAMGRSDLFLKLEIIKKFVDLFFLLLTMRISVIAMTSSLLISSLICQIVNSWPNWKLLNYSYLNQIKDILPSLILAVFMGLCIYPIKLIGLSDILTLIFQILAGAIIYISGSKFFGIESYKYITELLVSYLPKKRV